MAINRWIQDKKPPSGLPTVDPNNPAESDKGFKSPASQPKAPTPTVDPVGSDKNKGQLPTIDPRVSDSATVGAATAAEGGRSGRTVAERNAIQESGDQSYRKGRHYLDADKSTVAGQMRGLLEGAESDPMVQMQKSRALQGMNARGLQNSSMATTAADAAMYQYLTPIAQQDAATYAAMDQLDADYDFKMDFWNKQNAFDKMALEKNLSLDERQMMTSAFSGMFNTMLSGVSRILVDPDLNAAGKKTSIEELYKNYQDSVETFSDLNQYDITW